MKVGIDCRLWNETGVGRYIHNLVTNLSQIDKNNEYILLARAQDEKDINSLVYGSPQRPSGQTQFTVVRTDIHWHGISEQIELPKILNKQNLDLVHFPYFSVPIFYYRPFIVTIHDLIVNKFNTGRASTLPLPLYFVKRIGYHLVLSNAVYRSKKIIVPSNAVRDDLLKAYLNIDPSKIVVTYEGGLEDKIKSQKSPASPSEAGRAKVEGKYILRIGNFYPHKNVEGLLKAFSQMNSNDLKLILVGKKDYFYKRIEREIEELNINSKVVFLEGVNDEKLVSLYKNAVATIVPSFSEGFSLTAVEAMSLECPVIASDIPVHREICSNAAIYCNPNNINDIKQKISFACSLIETSRRELISQGKTQAKQFSWTTMAKKTLAIYNSLMVSNSNRINSND